MQTTPPDSNKNTDFKKQLVQLQKRYIEHLHQKCVDLHSKWAIQLNLPPGPSTVLKHLISETQALTISSSTFELKKFSRMCSQLEKQFKTLADDSSRPQEISSEISFIFKNILSLAPNHEVEPFSLMLPVSPPAESLSKLIYIVDHDIYMAEYLRLQISCFGYQVRHFGSMAALEAAFAEAKPATTIIAINLPLAQADLEVNQRIRQTYTGVPLIFLSANYSQTDRLHSVRAGGNAFFIKPVEINELIDTLDALTHIKKNEPFKVLFVEDSVSLAAFYAEIMRQQRMEACIVNEPLEMLEKIIEFAPDIVVMDLYLPGWNGYELVTMLRQQEMFVSLPVIFLSTEHKVDLHLVALQAGGDDFLTKPINPDYLVASINHRAERYRNLRRHMVEDGLTGLYNQVKTKELLTVEIARAQRAITPMAFVMLDIDYFKRINDVHGHPVGDRVLKTLAKFLKQGLRRADIIGRFGGEEFALILPGTDLKQAQIIMNNLRLAFEQIQHHTHDGVFNVTFSAGICSYPQFGDATAMCAAADLALYDAKHSGRNRVSITP